MAPEVSLARQFRLPKLHSTFKLSDNSCFWDIRFYPYLDEPTDYPIFAIVGTSQILVCSITKNDEQAVNVLVSTKLESPHGSTGLDSINSCVWCYINPSQPLIGVAGDSGQVNVIDALTGRIFTTLLGHGLGTINDLAAHPRYPWIIASASMDTSVRVWDLRRTNKPSESACIIVCGHGQAHKEGLLTVGWHQSGRYIVTAGHDQKVCVWTLPDLHPQSDFWPTISKAHRTRSSDDVHVVHYPHFISSAIHSDYIDKAIFFGDMILSKAAKEHKIVLWQITGFNSHVSPPTSDTAPKTNEYLDTRNGFIRKKATNDESSILIEERFQGQAPYERYLEFNSPSCESFYMRFGFLQPSRLYPELHPTLAMGNNKSEIRFWDIERLRLGHDGGFGEPRNDQSALQGLRKAMKPKKGIASKVSKNKDKLGNVTLSNSPTRPDSRDSSVHSSSVATPSTTQPREASTEATSHTSEVRSSIESPVPDRMKYPLDDPQNPLEEHKKVKVADLSGWTARASDWSPCGHWCLVVGEWQSTALAVVLERPL